MRSRAQSLPSLCCRARRSGAAALLGGGVAAAQFFEAVHWVSLYWHSYEITLIQAAADCTSLSRRSRNRRSLSLVASSRARE